MLRESLLNTRNGNRCAHGVGACALAMWFLAGPAPGQFTCDKPIEWAATNYYANVEVPGFNEPNDILSGACLALEGPGQLAALVDVVFPKGIVDERGARFYIDNDPDNPNDAQAFEIWALVRYRRPGAMLRAEIRQAPPEGQAEGEYVEADLPVVAGPVVFWPQPQGKQFCWTIASFDLGAGRELASGDYYFCVRQDLAQGVVFATSYYELAVEESGDKGGLFVWNYDLSWLTTKGDPLIVLRRCTPLPGNHPPHAVAKIDGSEPVSEGDNVQFYGGDSYDEDPNTALTYTWDFGDGSALSYLRDPNYVYDDPNTYTVTLTVSDGLALDVDTLTVRVLAIPPPCIGRIIAERRVGADEYVEIEGVHEGDTEDTRVRFRAASITDSSGGNCDNCTFLWEDSLDALNEELADDRMPEGHIEDLYAGVVTTGQHRLKLTVTDPNSGLSTSREGRFWISPLPTLTTRVRAINWKEVDFEYYYDVPATLTTAAVSLTNAGRVELTNHLGVPLQETPIHLDSLYDEDLLADHDYSIAGLRRNGVFVWDSDDCPAFDGCFTMSSHYISAQAVGLVDTNGYHLPQIPPDPPPAEFVQHVRVEVPPEKLEWYDLACERALECGIATVAGAALGFAGIAFPPLDVGAAIAEVDAARCAYEHDVYCARAHDPLIPDPEFQDEVGMALEYPAANGHCTSDAEIQALAAAAERGAVIPTALLAYNAALNKLAGVYTFVNPADPNLPFYAEVQGSEVIRYGQILAVALADTHTAWAQAHAAWPMTGPEIADVQQQLLQDGWPPPLATTLESLGVDIGFLMGHLLSLNPTQAAEVWNAGPSAAALEVGELLMDQSYFAAPTGLVLVGITRPFDGEAVSGMITIDARVVHKKELYPDCVCGDTVVTDVILDQGQPEQQILAQVPVPGPNCDGLNPAPSAVPVLLNTDSIAEGSHTITVIARDGCQPLPPFHWNADAVTFIVDRTSPQVAITSPDEDPVAPGIQVFAGDSVTYAAFDDGSGLVGPVVGMVGTAGGAYTQEVCVADCAGNTASADVEVLRPHLENEVVRAGFTDYGTSGRRFGDWESPDIAWLPILPGTQVASWEGNLRYDAGQGATNHFLADPNAFTATYLLHREGAAVASWSENSEFKIAATHTLAGAQVTTHLAITNIAGQDLDHVSLAWMLDADLVVPGDDPACPSLPWLGWGTGRWYGAAGRGMQNNLYVAAGLAPATIEVVHAAAQDETVVPSHWTVSNPVGFQGSTCQFDGPVEAEPRYRFLLPYDNTEGCVGFDQDLAIVTAFGVETWPMGVTHTFDFTLTFRTPGDADLSGVVDEGDFTALTECLNGPGSGPTGADCQTFDFRCDDDVDLTDVADFQVVFGE